MLGILTSGAEAIAPLKTFLTFNSCVGPLSGKTGGAVAAYLVSWAILAYPYRDRDVSMRRAFTVTFVLVTIALVLTFPLFYEYVI